MLRTSIIFMCLAGCNLGPRVDDAPDAPGMVKSDGGFQYILPAGTNIPSIDTDPALVVQIRINDGILDTATTLPRSTGKVAGATVRFWNFGPAPYESTFAVLAPIYILGTMDGAGFTPLATHPRLIDTIPGDTRYSPIRRVINVPVTNLYKGELITSMAALGEALDAGLISEPVNDGTWINLPVVLPTQTLEVAAAPAAPATPTQVFARGFKVDVFELGTSVGRQPLRSNTVPIGQASGLQTGVATGTPPTQSTVIDPQPIFMFPIPTMPPGMTFSYSPLAFDVTVRLANGVAPSAINDDLDLFRRNATGVITAFDPANVANFTVQTTMNNLQVQFADGAL